MTFKEVVDTIAKGIGRDIRYQPISIHEFKEGMKGAGLPDSYVWLFGYLFKEVLGNPDNQVVSNDIERVLGRTAIDFEEFVENTVETGVWNQHVSQSI